MQLKYFNFKFTDGGMLRRTFPKRSVELKDFFLILLGWAVHRVLDFVWGAVKKRRIKVSRKPRKPFIQVIGDRFLDMVIKMLFDDEEIAWAKIQQEQRRRSGKAYPLHTF